ncbi:MAG: AmmeMemoRadiSam system protein B [Kiritimatiellae bacterium]|nr:AmmeMemoRadiSam system protein B [Kiritimatiellia bacterium]MDW8458543.1 AmmeMemoRadiSam system protein B [Verrucomicrobiota bacterium]
MIQHSTIRKAAVAGTFYPEDGAELHYAVRRYLDHGFGSDHPPKAVIAPHAGYMYSGPVAGSAFRAWSELKGHAERVVLIGPSHRVAFDGVALPSAHFFATPLGLLPVDSAVCEMIQQKPYVSVHDGAHRYEHSLETHLPFLQETVGDVPIVPVVVGDASALDIAELIESLWDMPGTFFSISSDLSHYLPYAEARRVDAETSRAIENCDVHGIGPDRACGWLPILGLLHVAARRKVKIRTLDLRNSGDTAGDRGRVVGYGAYAVG